MSQRIHYPQVAPGVYRAMAALDDALASSGLDTALLYLVQLRVSQIHGCAYCLDMHWKDLRALGEGEQRLFSLGAWRESAFYTARERAALGWVEAVTHVASDHVPDAAWSQVREEFSEAEVAWLTLAAATIGSWNRLSIAARLSPKADLPGSAS